MAGKVEKDMERGLKQKKEAKVEKYRTQSGMKKGKIIKSVFSHFNINAERQGNRNCKDGSNQEKESTKKNKIHKEKPSSCPFN